MTETQRAAMQQALECLKGVARGKYDGNAACVCAALEAALAEPEPEPVAVRWRWPGHRWTYDDYEPECFYAPRVDVQRLYTTPPARQPLTEQEIVDAVRDADLDWHTGWSLGDAPNRYIILIRAIERAHGIGGNDE